MREERFSTRHGYVDPEKPISSREEASLGLRHFVAEATYDLDYAPSFLRKIVCQALDQVPDESNWSERPNIAWEVESHLKNCEWYYIFDIIEDVAHALSSRNKHDSDVFHNAINDYFKRRGIGWKLEADHILFRGDDAFETTLKKAEAALASAGKQTAGNEIKEAIRDLSRKPDADITGAIQHGLAALECISREAVSDKKMTLGELIKKNRNIVPPPLDAVIEKAWGYSSEQGRHLQEGREPSFDEAELLVGLAAAISTYIVRKLPQLAPEPPKTDETDNPFEYSDESELPF